ncbi:MAG: carbohydrate kinase family protein [Nitrospiraceae bacterium]|nr:carbohydrate kinase family protein [Nitrospiraceae bacterium]
MKESVFIKSPSKPAIWGTGFIALDLILSGTSKKSRWLWAGGTCGNVLTILSFLGWEAYPISRLNGDAASRLVQQDLARWGVHLKFAKSIPSAKTPIVIERIGQKPNGGGPKHQFTWLCPACGSWVPGYAPVLVSAAKEIVKEIKDPKVFFLDRVSPGALILAKASLERGALIVFEPSGVGDQKLFGEALEIAHIVKYSHERIKDRSIIASHPNPFLQIETFGKEGLRYKSRLGASRTRGWRRLEAFTVPRLKDTAGAGDWCTAGIIHLVGDKAFSGFKSLTLDALQHALRFGQALAAWNCMFEGARGGMYAVRKNEFKRDVSLINAGREILPPKTSNPASVPKRLVKTICQACVDL